MFQTELENMMGKSGLKLKLDAPQAIVDDPTLEVKRLEAFVSTTRFFITNKLSAPAWMFLNILSNPALDVS